MSAPPPLSALSDPTSLGKTQILLVPVHPVSPTSHTGSVLTDAVYKHWTSLIKHHTSIRSDEIAVPSSSSGSGSAHVRGGQAFGPRARFFPSSSATSVSRANTSQYLHLTYPAHPPARHLYPLSLLRMTAFPLVVIGITVASDSNSGAGTDGQVTNAHARGYSVDSEEGDIGEASTPRAAQFQINTVKSDPLKALDDTLAEMLPPSSPFPLVKRVVVVPPHVPMNSSSSQMSPRKANGRSGDKRKSARKEVQYAPTEGAESWIAGLVGEVVGELLEELGDLATALETPTGLKTLSSTLLPSLTSTLPNASMHDFLPVRSSSSSSDHSRSSSTTPTGMHGPSLDALNGSAGPPSGNGVMGISLRRALTPGGRPTSVAGPSVSPIDTTVAAPVARVTSSNNPFRRSTVLSSPFTRTPSAASITSNSSAGGAQSPVIAQRYTQANLSGIAGGRLMKVLGDFYLLIGQYGDAIKCYDDGAERSRVAGDPLWEGVAREGRAVAAIGEAWEARDGSDRVQSFSSSPIPVEILAHYLSALSCISKAPLPYPPTILSPSPQAVSGSLSIPAPSAAGTVQLGTGEGLLAYLYTSLCLKIAHFQLIIWAASGWGSIALSCLMGHTLPRSFPLPLELRGSSTLGSSRQHEDSIEKRASYDAHAHRRRRRFLALLSSRAGLTRSSIYTNAEAALGPHHRGMTKPEQLAVHVELIWLARYLDLPRHEAVVSREAARKVAGMVVEGREEMRRMAKMGAHTAIAGRQRPHQRDGEDADASVGLGLGMTVAAAKGESHRHSQAGVAVRRKESTDGNPAIMHLLERALAILGVGLLPPFPALATASSIVRRADDLDALSSRKTMSGWPELQVDALQSAITVAEAMADHHNVARLSLSALRGVTAYLSPQSQGHLAKLAPAALGVLKRRGSWDAQGLGGVGWWVPGRFVLSLEVSSLPVEHSTSEIQAGTKDPFLYNPRTKAAQAGKTVLVANEQVDVFVTLSNPFAFDLEIADLGLITSGTPFLANPLPVLLPASSVQTIRITGACSTSGTLTIHGVRIRLPDGARTEVLMPMVDAKAKERREKRKSRIMSEAGKMKRSGLEVRLAGLDLNGPGEEDGSKRSSTQSNVGGEMSHGAAYQLEEGEKWLECQVVPEQPLLWVKKSSLTHGTVMLYDGERTTMRLTLENSSGTPVNFIKLSFEDNTMREASVVLAEEITPRHAYEIQHDQLHRPVMRWYAEQAVDIKPGARASVAVECFGKIGCTDGTIRIDYGFVRGRDAASNGEGDANSASMQESFHTRSITFPILFTVYDTVEPHDLDILPFPPRQQSKTALPTSDAGRHLSDADAGRNANEKSDAQKRQLSINVDVDRNSPTQMSLTPRSTSFAQAAIKQDALRQALTNEADDQHCLVALSVRNIFGVPFEVCLARVDDKEAVEGGRRDEVVATRLVPPGATERLIIPLPRLALSAEHLAQPIPTLGSRQYVVDKTGRSSLEIQQEQELFWYRQSLLSMLRLTYVEPGTKREGEIGLRRVTLEQVDRGGVGAFKVDEVEVRVWYEGETRQGEFGTVCCAVVNRTERPIAPHIRLEPISPSLDIAGTFDRTDRLRKKLADQAGKHIIFDGVLSQDLPELEPGAEERHEVGVMFLAAGQYGMRAIVEYASVTAGATGAQGKSKISDVLRIEVA